MLASQKLARMTKPCLAALLDAGPVLALDIHFAVVRNRREDRGTVHRLDIRATGHAPVHSCWVYPKPRYLIASHWTEDEVSFVDYRTRRAYCLWKVE